MVDVKIFLLNLLMINNSNWLIPGLVSLSYGTWNDDRVMLLKNSVAMNRAAGKRASLETLACSCGDVPCQRTIYYWQRAVSVLTSLLSLPCL